MPFPRARTERRWFFASLALHALVGAVCVLAVRLGDRDAPPVRRDFAAMNFRPVEESAATEASQAAAPAEPPPELPVPETTEPEAPDVPALETQVLAEVLAEEPPPEPLVSVPPLPVAPRVTRVRPAPPVAVPAVTPAPPPPPPVPPAPRAAAAPPSGAVEGAKPFATNRVVYPAEARARGITGVVLLRIGVGVTGRVTTVDVLRSSGHAVLDEAAKTDALGWQFSPARRGGVPVPARLDQPVGYYVRAGR